MDADALKKAFARIEFDRVLAALNDDANTEVPDLTALRKADLTSQERPIVVAALLICAKRLLFAGCFSKASQPFSLARELDPENQLLSGRVALLRQLPSREEIQWRISLQEMQRQFQTICNKTPCSCESHYQMGQCLGMFGHDHPCILENPPFSIVAISLYHSWSLATLWSKLVKRIKRDFEQQLLPFVGPIVADFIRARTDFLRSVDVLVPVPPSPVKYGKRGFAPTCLLADEISRMLAIPVQHVLNRLPGASTREATDEELAAQITIETRASRLIRGASVLLVEDVVTTGRTVRICAEKLMTVGAKAVSTIALARSKRI